MRRGLGLRLLSFLAAAAGGALLLAITYSGAGVAAAALALVALSLLAGWTGGLVGRAFERAGTGAAGRDGVSPSHIAEARAMAAALQRDAEEWARHLQATAGERAQLALLIDAVSEGIIQVSLDRRLLRVNPAARRLLALPPDAEGRAIDSAVRSADARQALADAATHGSVAGREVIFDDRTLIVSARPLKVDGERAGAVVAVADITQLRRLESVRRDFVANASHELKTPLTSIRGYAETLLTDDLPPAMRRGFLETIHSNTARLQNIIDDLLDLSRLESGRWQPQWQDVDVVRIAEESWQDFATRAREGGVAFRVEVGAPDPAGTAESRIAVRADPSALRQVLCNLYDNALRYTPSGGRISVRVAPSSAEAGTHDAAASVSIAVSDTGSGIPIDALPRIFERFYRVDPARSREEGGTGLGLSIVKHLVEAMEGKVEAESRLGRGTTIRVLLRASTDYDFRTE